MLLCVQEVTAKGHPKFRKARRGKQLSDYKQCYICKNQSLEVSKYMNSALSTCDPRTNTEVVYTLAFYIWLLLVVLFVHFNCLHVCCLLFTSISRSHLLTVTAVSACFCALELMLPGCILSFQL